MKPDSLVSTYIKLICVALLLGACAVPIPPPAAEMAGGTVTPPLVTPGATIPPSPSPTLLACESVITIDPGQAFRNKAYLDRNLFWTVHFNFKSFDAHGEPVGCYRLYARDGLLEKFVPIDGDGYVIEGCHTHGNVTFSNTNLSFNSEGRASNESDNAGVATFADSGYIECDFSIQSLTSATINQTMVASGTTNLNELLALHGIDPAQHLEIGGEYDLLTNGNNHTLHTLGLIAAGQVSTTDEPSSQPVFFYVPTDPAATCCTPLGMELPTDDATSGLFRSYLDGQLFRSITLNSLVNQAVAEGTIDVELITEVMDASTSVEEIAAWLSLQPAAEGESADELMNKVTLLGSDRLLIDWLIEIDVLGDWITYLVQQEYLPSELLVEWFGFADIESASALHALTDQCTYLHEQPYYWWTDFTNDGQHEVTPTFAKQRIAPSESGVWCKTVEWLPLAPTDLSDEYAGWTFAAQPRVAAIEVWTGPAKLYIGCRPDMITGACASFFTGELYSIMIDPPDSKPQFD